MNGKRVAFLPRHGKDHRYPPHKINYRANLWAMKELGVKRIIGPSAAGSLQPHIKPGDFVVVDQFVNRTWGRADTFFDGPITKHISAADPYCAELRSLAIKAANELKINVHPRGTVVVIQGPRFSTRAESKEFSERGWEVINMTQYPEGYLAKELGICYVNIALITDYDAGLEDDPQVQPVTHEEVMRVFQANIDKVKQLITTLVEMIPVGTSRSSCEGVGLPTTGPRFGGLQILSWFREKRGARSNKVCQGISIAARFLVRHPVEGRAVVSSAHPLASKVGLDTSCRRNVVDAAVAVSSSWVLLNLSFNHRRRRVCCSPCKRRDGPDFRVAPKGSHRDMFAQTARLTFAPAPKATVPSWFRPGRWSSPHAQPLRKAGWGRLWEPAIGLASQGVLMACLPGNHPAVGH